MSSVPSRGRERGLRVGIEAQAEARCGDEVAGPAAIGFHFAADGGHLNPQVVGLADRAGTPHPLEELVLGDEVAGMSDEHFDDPPLRRSEDDLGAVGGDLTVEDTPGGGATFVFSLPRAPA